MTSLLRISLICCMAYITLVIHAQDLVPFDCEGQYFLSLSPTQSAPSDIYEINLVNGSVELNLIKGDINGNINAIGYRSTDNFIYGWSPVLSYLYRMDATGRLDTLRYIPELSTSRFYAGDVTPDGDFLVLSGSYLGGVYFAIFDLNDPNYDFDLVPASRPNTRISDISFDPTSGTLYGFDGQTRMLAAMDYETGQIDLEPINGNPQMNSMGALYFDPFGTLYGYSGTPAAFHRIDVGDGEHEITQIATAPDASGNDGCSCVFFADLRVSTIDTWRPCDTLTYTIDIANSTAQQLDGLTIRMVLPQGFTYLDIVPNGLMYTDSSTPGEVLLTDLALPAGTHELRIEVYVDQVPSRSYAVQAFIENLPEQFGTTAVSDNPRSPQVEDSTRIFITEPPHEYIEEEIQLCRDDSTLIDVITDDVLSYKWADGTDGGLRYVTDTGTYEVLLSYDCSYMTKTIRVAPSTHLYGTKQYRLCADTIAIVEAGISADLYQWADGDSLSTKVFTTVDTMELFMVVGCGFVTQTVEILPAEQLTDQESAVLCAQVGSELDLTVDGEAYLWDDGSQLPTRSIDAPGDYVVTITGDCAFTTKTISVAPAPVRSDSLTYTMCAGDDYTLAFDLEEALYTWDDGQTDSLRVYAQPGTYRVTIADDCEYLHRSVLLMPPLETTDIETYTLCADDGHTMDYGILGAIYTWEDGTQDSIRTVVTSGQYAATIDDACTWRYKTITIDPYVTDQIDTTMVICKGIPETLLSPVPSDLYLWDDGSVESDIIVDQEGLYFTTVTNCIETSISWTVVADDLDMPELLPHYELSLGDPLTVEPIAVEDDLTYVWVDSLNLSDYCHECEALDVIPLFDNAYQVVVTDAGGCLDTLYTRVAIDKQRVESVANVFSPNGDSSNDIFYLKGNPTTVIEDFRVYDRWGIMVHRSSGLLNDDGHGWDGRYRGADAIAGVYVYTAQLRFIDGYVQYLSGDILVAR